MDRRSTGRADLRRLRRRLDQMRLAIVFLAWASEGKEEGEWFCWRLRRHRFSYRDGPSHALLCDCVEAVADASMSVMTVASYFAVPLQDSRGRVYVPPFTTDHLARLRALCRLPESRIRPSDLDPRDVSPDTDYCRLCHVFRWFWLWQGFLWAFTYVFLRASSHTVQKSTSLDSAAHCDAIVQGIRDSWDRRQSAEAFAALRRVGAGSKRRRMVRGLPILHDAQGRPVTTELAAAKRWQQYFGHMELAATIAAADANDYHAYFERIPYAEMSRDAVLPLGTIASLSDYQRSCRQARRAASGCDGITGNLVHSFATDLAALFYPLQLKSSVTLVEPLQWKGVFLSGSAKIGHC